MPQSHTAGSRYHWAVPAIFTASTINFGGEGMSADTSMRNRITCHEAILLRAHPSDGRNGEARTGWLSNGETEFACLIPSQDLRHRLLSEPLTSYWMQLVDWGDGSGDGVSAMPVLTDAEIGERLMDPLRLMPPSVCPVERVLDDTLDLIDGIKNVPLWGLVHDILRRRDVASVYWTSPASRKHHHAFPGGLAAHSLEVALDLATQSSLADHERELCIVGGLLHDIGKIWAYTPDMFLSAPAKAMGHELLGLSRIEPELAALERTWSDGAYALRVMLSGNGRMRQDGSMPSSLLARLKAADQRSCEQDRCRRHEEGAWSPVAYLPTSPSSSDSWLSGLADG